MGADWSSLGIRCPRCLEELDTGDASALKCVKCSATYPIHHGIPDLRTGDDPYLSKDKDLEAANALAARAATMNFRELLTSYYATNDKVPAAQVALFSQGTLAAAERAETTLTAWERRDARVSGIPPSTATFLDVGCGTGPLAIAAARRGWRVIGVDVGLRWLVLAQKRAREAELDIPFICANAEVLPFCDGVMTRVGGESILENTADPGQALHEFSRVLMRGGRLWLTTPNKRSLGPDPHLGVIAGGWWPEGLLKRHATRAGKVYPKRKLFTRGELRQLLEAADFGGIEIALPDIAQAQRDTQTLVMQSAIAGYQAIKRLPIAGSLMGTVAPTFLVTATRV
ncbi:MAG TPA: methyltransferase domain-containing protein [Gemmatimonadaceae bacterium]|nr:methyltransferase domain-containing protein [Gemmatimonadaceae bacterium]